MLTVLVICGVRWCAEDLRVHEEKLETRSAQNRLVDSILRRDYGFARQTLHRT